MSYTGLHQGDNKASFPVMKRIAEEVPELRAKVWFQDYGNFVGSASALNKVIAIIREHGPEHGLILSEDQLQSPLYGAPASLYPTPLSSQVSRTTLARVSLSLEALMAPLPTL